MLPDVTVEWVTSPGGRIPSEEARHALVEWAVARGVHLQEAETSPLPALKPDLAVADAVEELLDRAHDAVIAQDTDAAERALAGAEGLLRAHPELPQASWLLAEVMRGWAVRWARLRPQDNVRAAEAWRRGAGLDGGRAAGVGEPGASERRAAVTATLALDGTGQASLDGVGVSEGPFQSADGDHQLVVTRNGTLILAEWVTVVQGAVVRVAVPEVAACSREDLQRARGIEGTVVPSGVRCQAWVRVQELDVGAVKSDLMLTVCERDTCGAPVRWSVGLIADAPRPVGGPAKHWPRWATWALVGAGAIAATGTALAAAGAFRPTRGEPIFTTNGLHTTSVSPGLEIIGR